MPFLPDRGPLIAALGAGIVIGGGGVLVYFKVSRSISADLQRLSAVLAELRRDLNEIKERLLENNKSKRKRGYRPSGYFSVHASTSGDDDEDVYEEAYEGSSEFSSGRDYGTPEAPSPQFGEGLSNTEFYQEVDKLLDSSDTDKERGYLALQQRQMKCTADPDFLWRLSKACYLLAFIHEAKGDNEKKKELLFLARDHASTAVMLNEESANAHKWLASSLGSTSGYGGVQEQIKSAYVIREHMERAIELNPTDPTPHYLLGRWCYSVYMMTWIERKVASTLFGTPPVSTAEEALEHFLEAERLKSGQWKENMLYIAKCYVELRQYEKVVRWAEEASELPTISTDDRNVQTEVENLLIKYRG